jgi:4-amino-4-deoxy-L-arabinose transferase-like glycosyltransferase
MLAPPIAALTGAGWVTLWNQYKNSEGWKKWLLPSAILVTTAFELYVLYPYQEQVGIGWSIGIGAAGIGLSLVLFFATAKQKLSAIVALAGMLALLVGPLYWATTPILYGENSMLPQAGPGQQGFGPGPGMAAGSRFISDGKVTNQRPFAVRSGMRGGPGSRIDAKLLQYVTRHNTGEKYLFATTNANSAAPYIIETGKPVMAMGGFSGSDPILTVEKLKQLVKNNEVKFFLIPSGSGFGGRFGNSEVLNWIRAHGKEVPRSQWQSNVDQRGQGGPEGDNALYEIKG